MNTPFPHLLVILGILSQSVAATAQNAPAGNLVMSPSCRLLGDLATTIMTERQKNTPMSEMMSRIRSSARFIGFEGLPVDENGLAKIVVLAYQTPRFRTPDAQSAEIGEFRNDIELLCYNRQLEGN